MSEIRNSPNRITTPRDANAADRTAANAAAGGDGGSKPEVVTPIADLSAPPNISTPSRAAVDLNSRNAARAGANAADSSLRARLNAADPQRQKLVGVIASLEERAAARGATDTTPEAKAKATEIVQELLPNADKETRALVERAVGLFLDDVHHLVQEAQKSAAKAKPEAPAAPADVDVARPEVGPSGRTANANANGANTANAATANRSTANAATPELRVDVERARNNAAGNARPTPTPPRAEPPPKPVVVVPTPPRAEPTPTPTAPKPPVVVTPRAEPSPTPTPTTAPKPPVVVTPRAEPTPTPTAPKPPVVVTPRAEPTPTPTPTAPKPPVVVTPRAEPTPTPTAPKPPVVVPPRAETTPTPPPPKPPVATTTPAPTVVPPAATTPTPPVVTPTPAPATPAPVRMERRYETAGAVAEADRPALHARTLVQLKEQGLAPKDARLDSKLPADVQKRVDADPNLKDVKTWSGLLDGVTGDGDKNGRLDVDAFDLARTVGGTQQQTLQALMSKPEKLESKLVDVGLDKTKAAAAATNKALGLAPPSSFGTEGRTIIDKVQQQLLLRDGVIFADSNKNQKLDDDDKVSFLDHTNGTIKETTFKDLSPELKKAVKLNMATAAAAEDYVGKPRMVFPSYDPATGRAKPEAVNKDLWEINKAGGPSWELKAGKTPADAVVDPFTGNGAKYTTECAQGRTMMRLKGLHDYHVQEYGKGEGTFRFNAEFAKGPESQKKAAEYLTRLDEFKQKNPGKGFDDFAKTNAPPKLDFSLEVSRHNVLGDGRSPIQPFGARTGEAAPGDPGYFHNTSVTVEGVNIGYVGENVIDVGFKRNEKTGELERHFWGHPGGIHGEQDWQKELDAPRLQVKNMEDYGQYFSKTEVRNNVRNWSEREVDIRNDKIAKLKADKPAGFEESVKKLEAEQGYMTAAGGVYQAAAVDLDPKKSADLKKHLEKEPVSMATPEDTRPFVNALTDGGRAKLVTAFDALGTEHKDALAKRFGKSADKLSESEKQQASMLLIGQRGGQLDGELKGILQQSLVNEAAGEWLNPPSGKLSSKDEAQKWVSSPEFKKFYKEKTGADFSGETNLSKMEPARLQQIVELALPATSTMGTIYAEVNRGDDRLSAQMATLLKEGKLPGASYRPD
ncbi:MAG: hypothetical protein Q8O67_08505 [Deltaproteobacteria bacterium]|nr:hypothetical protein [Deltaproteobacteria bacterium]